MSWRRYFQRHSRVNLPRAWYSSSSGALHFRPFPNLLCLLCTLSIFIFSTFRIRVHFAQRNGRCMAVLPNLRSLLIGFRSPLSRPLQITPPPRTRAVLHALTNLSLSSVSEYYEDFAAQIDAPLLRCLFLVFFIDLIHFIDRTERLKQFNQAFLRLRGQEIIVTFGSPTEFHSTIRCERPDWQLSPMSQIFGHQLPLLSHTDAVS
jgi:hypothetical protein